jgi:hypothetical protein
MITTEQYAQAVREALADHPERDELLEDLDDHLAEIAAESDVPLEERLGPPEAYAEDLLAAYEDRPESAQKRRYRVRDRLGSWHSGLRGQSAYRGFAAFLPELRPGWWVLRGYVLAMLLLSLPGEGRVTPQDPVDWVVLAAAVWASVWLGRRTRGRLLATLAIVANLAGAVALLAALTAAQFKTSQPVAYAVNKPMNVLMVGGDSDNVYNIKPYAKDGTPLTDVYLYDQDGNPVLTHPEDYGYTVDPGCGEPILNRYPLPLIGGRMSTGRPSTCESPEPVPMKTAPATPTETPRPR